MAARIRANHAAVTGRTLPSETACAAHFGVSRPTVRQTVQHLVAGGLVCRGRGRGIFVAPRHDARDFCMAFEEDQRIADGLVRFRLLEFGEAMAPAAVAQHHGFSARETVFRIRRCRTVNGAICACEQRYLPSGIAHRVTPSMLEEMAGVPLLTTAMRQPPLRVVSSLCCRPVNAWVAELLGVNRGTAVPQVEHTCHATSDRQLMHGTVWFRPDGFLLELETDRCAAASPDVARSIADRGAAF